MSSALIWLFIALLGVVLCMTLRYLSPRSEGFVDMAAFGDSQASFMNPSIQSLGDYSSSIKDFLLNTPSFDDDPEFNKRSQDNPMQTMPGDSDQELDQIPRQAPGRAPNQAPSQAPRQAPSQAPSQAPNQAPRQVSVRVSAANTKEPSPTSINTQSEPEPVNIESTLSSLLSQGTLFKSTLNKPPEKTPENHETTISPNISQCPACPTCPPAPKCPPAPICPPAPPAPECPEKQCPDMRNYIRKDEIPCWGCKIDD